MRLFSVKDHDGRISFFVKRISDFSSEYWLEMMHLNTRNMVGRYQSSINVQNHERSHAFPFILNALTSVTICSRTIFHHLS